MHATSEHSVTASEASVVAASAALSSLVKALTASVSATAALVARMMMVATGCHAHIALRPHLEGKAIKIIESCCTNGSTDPAKTFPPHEFPTAKHPN